MSSPEAPAYAPEAGIQGSSVVDFSLDATDFYARPWPSELSRSGDKLDLSAYPGSDAPIFSQYVTTARQDLDGFSLSPVLYFHFTGDVRTDYFPTDPKATRATTSSIFLVDVDPKSPDKGTFLPLETRYYPADLKYVPKGTLAVRPMAGFILRPNTLYAGVIRRAPWLGTTSQFEAVKWTRPRDKPAEEKARLLHREAFDALAAMGVQRADIAALALFRTASPHAVTEKLLDVITGLSGDHAPRVLSAAWIDALSSSTYWVIEGQYCTPNFQSGTEHAPYLSTEGGRFVLDSSGSPKVVELPAGSPDRDERCHGMLRARYTLSIPRAAMPAGGYPLLVSAHGTGGDARTFLGENNFAGWAAREGIAVVSTDQPLHGGAAGGRPGATHPPSLSIAGIPIPMTGAGEVSFYNPFFPATARDNLRQATADAAALVRLFGSLDFGAVQLLAARADRPKPRLDRDRILLAGHSQGSQSIAVLGALHPSVRGVLLSGSGADARLGILMRKDLEIMPILRLVLGVDENELDSFHPFMAMVQALADPIDPGTYARFYWEPLPGRKPQNVLHYEGVADTFTPPATSEALAVALRATQLEPVVSPVAGLSLLGLNPATKAKGDVATRAFVQYRSTQHENGHFVLYHEPGASDRARELFRSALSGPAEIHGTHP